MKTIYKIASNEKLLQVHFYQIYQKHISSEMSFCGEIDAISIEKKFPGFLETFDFNGVDVDILFNHLSIERRYGSEDWFSYTEKPIDFFYLSENELGDLNDITDLKNFPFLFYEYKKSPFNDLISINFYDSNLLYNLDGELLDNWNANLYDDGFCSLQFLDENYFAVIAFDENNGSYTRLWEYKDKNLFSKPGLFSMDELDLLYKNNINWNIEDLSNELLFNEKAILKTMECNGLIEKKSDEENPNKQIKDSVINTLSVFKNDFEKADEIFKKDRDIIKAAVENNGLNLQYAPDFIADKEIVLLAIKENAEAYIYCSETLSNDEEFIIEACKLNIKIMGFVNNNLIAKHKNLQILYDEFKLKINDDDLPFCIKGMDLDDLPF